MEQTNQSTFVAIPRIGDKAPEFKAVTTQGEINFPGDFKGRWVILFSHPADFTPVCTSEFMTFATLEPKFAEANCKLVGLSVDGLYSHLRFVLKTSWSGSRKPRQGLKVLSFFSLCLGGKGTVSQILS